MVRPRIIAVASGGGHLVQLQMMQRSLDEFDVHLVTTSHQLADANFVNVSAVPDCNRTNPIAIVRTCFALFKIVRKTRPDIIFSTGALPGAIAIIIGRIFKADTIWLDSIANVERLSLSARFARPFCTLVLTQWPSLARSQKVGYLGALL